MNTKEQHTEYHYKSGYADREKPNILAAAAILLARASFFQDFNPGEKETAQIKQQLMRRFAAANAPYDSYLVCCRNLQAYHHCLNGANVYPATRKAIEQLLLQEQVSNPYLSACSAEKGFPSRYVLWTGLAEALLEMQEDSPPDHFEYWIPWFRKRRAKAELLLFMRALEFQTFKDRAHENE